MKKKRIRVTLAACLLALVVINGLSSCASSAAGPKPKAQEMKAPVYGDSVPVRPTFNVNRSKGGSVKFDFLFLVPHDTNNAAFNVLFSITNCYCVIIDPRYGMLDTIDIQPATGITSIDPDNDSLLVSGNGYWLNPLSREYSDLILDIVIESGKKLYHDTHLVHLEATKEEEKAIALVGVKPFIDEQTDSSITFALLATRNRGAYLDYFPTSEKVRLELVNAKGVTVFSSATGMNFLQMVEPVDPLKKGEILRYTYVWNGKSDDGHILEAGTYTAKLSLVTKPERYQATIPVEWKGPSRDR